MLGFKRKRTKLHEKYDYPKGWSNVRPVWPVGA
jgi:hypothetical protein